MKLFEHYEKVKEENNEYRVQHEKMAISMSEGQTQFAKENDGNHPGH